MESGTEEVDQIENDEDEEDFVGHCGCCPPAAALGFFKLCR